MKTAKQIAEEIITKNIESMTAGMCRQYIKRAVSSRDAEWRKNRKQLIKCERNRCVDFYEKEIKEVIKDTKAEIWEKMDRVVKSPKWVDSQSLIWTAVYLRNRLKKVCK